MAPRNADTIGLSTPIVWPLLETIRADGHDSKSVIARIKEDWAVVKHLVLPDDAISALEQFVEW